MEDGKVEGDILSVDEVITRAMATSSASRTRVLVARWTVDGEKWERWTDADGHNGQWMAVERWSNPRCVHWTQRGL